MLSLIDESMKTHDAIFLEEPTTNGFFPMLQGTLATADYLMSVDVEYPEFSRRMCRLLQILHQRGKKIYQVEPFLKSLVEIHTFFANGHGPQDLNRDSDQYRVYLAERNAAGALLNYYKTVVAGSFDETVEAIRRFARQDAARFRLRDAMRAQAIITLLKVSESSYIEAGEMHYGLWSMLRRTVSKDFYVKPLFTAAAALETIGINSRFYGPGDKLTLLYVFHPTIHETVRERLLAARSLVYTKIIEKKELTEDLESFPHLRDEAACIQKVNQLSLEDCRNIFPDLRRTNTFEARQIVDRYFKRSKSVIRPLLDRVIQKQVNL
jgi:hypothetical protein